MYFIFFFYLNWQTDGSLTPVLPLLFSIFEEKKNVFPRMFDYTKVNSIIFSFDIHQFA